MLHDTVLIPNRKTFNTDGWRRFKPEALPGRIRSTKPTVALKVIDSGENYRIEIWAPNYRREDFSIVTLGSLLSVTARKSETHYAAEYNRHNNRGEEARIVNHEVILPADADPEFAAAEYLNNRLCIHVSRSVNPNKRNRGRIVVY